MSILQMMMARRMQQNQYGGRTNASGPAAAGCGCLSSIFGLIVMGVVLFGGWKAYDSAMNVVDDSMEQVDELVDDSLEELQSGDASGIGYEGTYTCEANPSGAVATLEITNTDATAHTYDLTWQMFAVPTDFGDIGDLTNLGDQLSGDALLDSFDDTFTLAPGESVTKTYEAPEVTDENVGCGPPFLMADMSIPDVSIPDVTVPEIPG